MFIQKHVSLTTPTKYSGKIVMCFSSVWSVTPLLLLRSNKSTRALFHDEMSETTGVGMSYWVISEQVLARWQHLVAYLKAMNLLHHDERARAERVGRWWWGWGVWHLHWQGSWGWEGRQHDNKQWQCPTTHNNQTEYGGGRRKMETVAAMVTATKNGAGRRRRNARQ